MTVVHFASRNRSDIAAMRPMSDAAERRAGQVADAAEHGRGERQQAELEAELEERLPVVQGDDETGRAGQAHRRSGRSARSSG